MLSDLTIDLYNDGDELSMSLINRYRLIGASFRQRYFLCRSARERTPTVNIDANWFTAAFWATWDSVRATIARFQSNAPQQLFQPNWLDKSSKRGVDCTAHFHIPSFFSVREIYSFFFLFRKIFHFNALEKYRININCDINVFWLCASLFASLLASLFAWKCKYLISNGDYSSKVHGKIIILEKSFVEQEKKGKKTRTHIYKRNHLKWGKKIRPTVRNLVYGEREKKEIAMEICKLQMEIAKFI